jgi:chromosome segregation ATPase
MNLVGKILIVAVFAMCMVFMGIAMSMSATHRNWKQVVESPAASAEKDVPLGLNKQLANAQQRNEELKNKLKQLEDSVAAEQAAATQVRLKLEIENEQIRKELADLRTRREALETEVRTAMVDVQKAHDKLAQLGTEIDALKAKILAADQHRAKAFGEVVGLEDEMNQLANERQRLIDLNRTLTADHAMASQVPH